MKHWTYRDVQAAEVALGVTLLVASGLAIVWWLIPGLAFFVVGLVLLWAAVI